MYTNTPNHKIKGTSFKQAAAPAAAPGVDPNQGIKELKEFVERTLNDISSYKKASPGPDATVRILTEWINRLEELKQENVDKSVMLNGAISKLKSFLPQHGTFLMRLGMFADGRWWDKVAAVFFGMKPFIDRAFVRPQTIYAKRPQHLNSSALVDVHLDENGNVVPTVSKDIYKITGALRARAMRVKLQAGIVQQDMDSMSTMLMLHNAAGKALLKNLGPILIEAQRELGTKAIKINLRDLFHKKGPYDDDAIILDKLRDELAKAISVSRTFTNLNPETLVYGTKIGNYDPKKKNEGFRDQMGGESKDVYFLRQKIYAAYGSAYVRDTTADLISELHQAQIDLKNPQNMRLGMDNIIYGSKLRFYKDKGMNNGFRSKMPDETQEMYNLRKQIFIAYGSALQGLLAKLSAEPEEDMQERIIDKRTTFNTAPGNGKIPAPLLTELVKQRLDLNGYLSKGVPLDRNHVVFGSKISDRVFRDEDVAIDYVTNLYESRKKVWQVWHDAWLTQTNEILELVKQLRKVEALQKDDALDKDYEGVPITAPKFRDYSVKLDHNTDAYLIKKRIWETLHGLRIAFENDIVVTNFQDMYDDTVGFIDDLNETIETITKNPIDLEALGDPTSPLRLDFASLINNVKKLNDAYTTTPWNKSFVLKNLLQDTGYVALVNTIITECASLSGDFAKVAVEIQSEIGALDELIRNVDVIDDNNNSKFLDSHKDIKKPESDDLKSVNDYLFQYLSKAVGESKYGIYQVIDMIK